MIKYIVGSLFIILIVLFIYVKIRYRFWSRQPVFHIYDILSWIWPKGIIQHSSPEKTRYYNHRIECSSFDQISAEKKDLFYHLIRSHFNNVKNTDYSPSRTQVLEYFKCHCSFPLISLHFEYFPGLNNINSVNRKLISSSSSRTLSGHLNFTELKVSYIDFLCVNEKYKDSGIKEIQLYTHYSKVREKGAPPIFLFRESKNPIVVPLTIFNIYAFHIKNYSNPNFDLPNNISSHLITTQNLELLVHYFAEIKRNFSCFLMPDMSHFKNLVNHSLMIPVLILDKLEPVGVYFYKYTNTSYVGDKCIECIGSYHSKNYKQIFLDSYSNTIALLKKKYKFSIILIENISYNHKLIKMIMVKDIPKWSESNAYYFYNFAYKPFFSPNVLILN
jgi:hypothetical protein